MTIWLHILAVAAVLLVFAAPAAADAKWITTEQEFRELVVDRELTGDETSLRYTGDGKMAGMSRGKPIKGEWGWVGAALCRMAALGSRNLVYDCQATFIVGDLVIIVRDEGRGRVFALRLPRRGGETGDSEEFACRAC